MKAILVLELDDEWYNRITTTCGEMLADVVLYKKESLENQCDYTQRVYRCWCPLKPMPERQELSGNEWERLTKMYSRGWNDCLDEILGEE